MSAAFPAHERANPTISQMEHATQSKPNRGPLAGDTRSAAVTTAQANVSDDESSGTPWMSLGSKQDTSVQAKEVNKRSLDYVLRSGCAGGLAGCAVSVIDPPTTG